MRRQLILTLLAAASLTLSGCGREKNYDNPQISEADRAQAAEQHPMILAEFGGVYEGPEARYVAALGEKIAGAAGVSGACTFTMVNTDVVNAFAVPGCYIYITRGLFAIVNSEAELASVLGHEIGHIVAEHSERRQRRAMFSGLGAALIGAVTGSERLAAIAGGAAQLYTLGYSRKQEFESDNLGIRYLAAAGYDPYAAADMLDALGDHEQLQATSTGRDDATSIPGWARTHPLAEDRVERAIAEAEEEGHPRGSLPEREEPYFAQVDDLLFGDDPEQGFVLGRRFAHPTMRISFEAPPGFSLTNTPRAVLISGPDNVRGEFGGGRLPRDGLEGYTGAILSEVLGNESVQVQPGEAVRTRVNGVAALIVPVMAQTREGQVQVTIAAYAGPDGEAYHFLMLSPAGGNAGGVESLFGSFRFLSPADVASLRPRRIEVVTARARDTLQSLAARMAYDDFKLERFLTLNGRERNQPVRPGEKLKIVVFG
ncbi:MAG TPA: M48 family metalloprotease [Allosphingosinicella sp.]|uniref:M48 family metalloprotease n=1 Tax=Allosphingosinicella sp. TaxID=2823234 RepID=UPI002EDAEEDA